MTKYKLVLQEEKEVNSGQESEIITHEIGQREFDLKTAVFLQEQVSKLLFWVGIYHVQIKVEVVENE